MSEQDARQAWSAAWVAAWAKLPTIEKRRTADAGSYSYTYADLADVVRAIQPVLAEAGLAVSQSVEAADNGVAVVTHLFHRDGWVVDFGPTVVPASGDARAFGSAITYARRYGLAAALGLVTDDDTDAEPTVETGTVTVGEVAPQFA